MKRRNQSNSQHNEKELREAKLKKRLAVPIEEETSHGYLTMEQPSISCVVVSIEKGSLPKQLDCSIRPLKRQNFACFRKL
jgi:hypothetical protein